MAESAGPAEKLDESRLLSEVRHLRAHLRPDGTLPAAVRTDMQANFYTAVQEMGMPCAVSTTIQRVDFETDRGGRARRMFKWLGRSAVEVAESGYGFHCSEPALLRVDCEVAEAVYSQNALTPGTAQSFISPRMSGADAPLGVARQEHLGDDDAVRTSRAITDRHGAVVARRVESLLVRDVPLQSWVAMLRDPHNLWGKTIDVADAGSALSVMRVFQELDLPEDKLPEGPVSLVAAVLPHITDERARRSVERQLSQFRSGQELYRRQAEAAAREWLDFDLELARSLEQGTATHEVEEFIAALQHEWGEQDLQVILNHDMGEAYVMTEKLAAVLEKARRNLLISRAALAVGNEAVIGQTDARTARRLRAAIGHIDALRSQGVSERIIAQQQADLMRLMARQNFKPGGGCAGTAEGSFKDGAGQSGESRADENGETGSWTWKQGVCRVKNCPSPQPTEVGPCSVCRNCQRKFDRGEDPTAGPSAAGKSRETGTADDVWRHFLRVAKVDKPAKPSDKPVAAAV